MRNRALIFAAICAVCVLVGGGWVLIAALGDSTSTSDAKVGVTTGHLDLEGRLLVRAVDTRDSRLNGRATLVRMGAKPAKAHAGELACWRIYERSGRGICLYTAASGVDYRVSIFDAQHEVVHDEGVDGIPSRARVSPSGRWGSITTFVAGHSYLGSQGGFSTKTLILDMASGKTLANLEQFTVEQDGKQIDRPDFNFWGTTFARDDDTFYATLATAGKRYLVKGSLRDRRVELLRENVECPSLSPDETRVAYKKRVGGDGDWRLHVLDLDSGRDVELAETHVVDDQAEWLDDETVLYGRAGSVWAVRANGKGGPERVLARAASPSTIRG